MCTWSSIPYSTAGHNLSWSVTARPHNLHLRNRELCWPVTWATHAPAMHNAVLDCSPHTRLPSTSVHLSVGWDLFSSLGDLFYCLNPTNVTSLSPAPPLSLAFQSVVPLFLTASCYIFSTALEMTAYSYSLALLPLWKTDSESLGVKFLLFILQLAGHSVTCGMAGAADRVCVPV